MSKSKGNAAKQVSDENSFKVKLEELKIINTLHEDAQDLSNFYSENGFSMQGASDFFSIQLSLLEKKLGYCIVGTHIDKKKTKSLTLYFNEDSICQIGFLSQFEAKDEETGKVSSLTQDNFSVTYSIDDFIRDKDATLAFSKINQGLINRSENPNIRRFIVNADNLPKNQKFIGVHLPQEYKDIVPLDIDINRIFSDFDVAKQKYDQGKKKGEKPTLLSTFIEITGVVPVNFGLGNGYIVTYCYRDPNSTHTGAVTLQDFKRNSNIAKLTKALCLDLVAVANNTGNIEGVIVPKKRARNYIQVSRKVTDYIKD